MKKKKEEGASVHAPALENNTESRVGTCTLQWRRHALIREQIIFVKKSVEVNFYTQVPPRSICLVSCMHIFKRKTCLWIKISGGTRTRTQQPTGVPSLSLSLSHTHTHTLSLISGAAPLPGLLWGNR